MSGLVHTMQYAFTYYRDLVSTNSNIKLPVMQIAKTMGKVIKPNASQSLDVPLTVHFLHINVSAHHPIFFYITEEY